MLPGRFCIGILEEDNPLKSYFRLKPLLVENEGKYEYFDGTALYAEEGCIRIVPDKNESSHFKARMRRMGRYCVLDLRDHAGENDKIRPNKNYHGDESEKNAHIVYSDVVREPAPDMIFEIASFDCETGIWEGAAPGTARIISPNSLETWQLISADEGEQVRIEKDGLSLAEEEIQRFDIPGFAGENLRLAVKLPAYLSSVTAVPVPRAKLEPAPKMEIASEAAAEIVPEAPLPEVPREEKPWISHGHMPQTSRSIDPRLSPVQQSLAAQSGLNPRRSRSLQEIIEEKWRHSRVDQLGHPVPAQAMGTPVENPVDRAMEALRDAWEIPSVHDELLDALSQLPEFGVQMRSRSEDIAREERRKELEDLEADRLKGLAALEKLRRDKHSLREEFKQEIRREEAAAFKDAVERTKSAQAECKKYEDLAEEARIGAEMAQDAFAALNDGRFENKLKDFALTSRAAELLSKPQPEPSPIEAAPEKPDREEWLARLRAALASEGLCIDDVQAANLLVCAALGDSLIFSGAAASDKLPIARALAKAIGGWQEVSEWDGADFDAAVAIVPYANCVPDADITRGLCREGRKVLAVAADAGSGFSIAPEALERAFLLRIPAPSADQPWRPQRREKTDFGPADPASLREAFIEDYDDLPPSMEKRLQRLRFALAGCGVQLSRRTLDMMWSYCGAMLACKCAPAEALDLAFAQKALPCILAEAPVGCLRELKTMLADMPRCLKLLEAPLPILI